MAILEALTKERAISNQDKREFSLGDRSYMIEPIQIENIPYNGPDVKGHHRDRGVTILTPDHARLERTMGNLDAEDRIKGLKQAETTWERWVARMKFLGIPFNCDPKVFELYMNLAGAPGLDVVYGVPGVSSEESTSIMDLNDVAYATRERRRLVNAHHQELIRNAFKGKKGVNFLGIAGGSMLAALEATALLDPECKDTTFCLIDHAPEAYTSALRNINGIGEQISNPDFGNNFVFIQGNAYKPKERVLEMAQEEIGVYISRDKVNIFDVNGLLDYNPYPFPEDVDQNAREKGRISIVEELKNLKSLAKAGDNISFSILKHYSDEDRRSLENLGWPVMYERDLDTMIEMAIRAEFDIEDIIVYNLPSDGYITVSIYVIEDGEDYLEIAEQHGIERHRSLNRHNPYLRDFTRE